MNFDCNQFESLIRNLWIYIINDIIIKYTKLTKINNILKTNISIYWCINYDNNENTDSYSLKNECIIDHSYSSLSANSIPPDLVNFLIFICNSKINIQ